MTQPIAGSIQGEGSVGLSSDYVYKGILISASAALDLDEKIFDANHLLSGNVKTPSN